MNTFKGTKSLTQKLNRNKYLGLQNVKSMLHALHVDIKKMRVLKYNYVISGLLSHKLYSHRKV